MIAWNYHLDRYSLSQRWKAYKFQRDDISLKTNMKVTHPWNDEHFPQIRVHLGTAVSQTEVLMASRAERTVSSGKWQAIDGSSVIESEPNNWATHPFYFQQNTNTSFFKSRGHSKYKASKDQSVFY